ncbi:hypothetical protein EHU80_23065 [Salmonella enterica]|nr:hypothetical protein [Salmonella enterica subsp. enterica serovar Cubana]EAR3863746.1 hypothetical protein [Salmonella enterica]
MAYASVYPHVKWLWYWRRNLSQFPDFKWLLSPARSVQLGLSSTTRQSKPISFDIFSRFVSASSKLKSVAFPFGYQLPAVGLKIQIKL